MNLSYKCFPGSTHTNVYTSAGVLLSQTSHNNSVYEAAQESHKMQPGKQLLERGCRTACMEDRCSADQLSKL